MAILQLSTTFRHTPTIAIVVWCCLCLFLNTVQVLFVLCISSLPLKSSVEICAYIYCMLTDKEATNGINILILYIYIFIICSLRNVEFAKKDAWFSRVKAQAAESDCEEEPMSARMSRGAGRIHSIIHVYKMVPSNLGVFICVHLRNPQAIVMV